MVNSLIRRCPTNSLVHTQKILRGSGNTGLIKHMSVLVVLQVLSGMQARQKEVIALKMAQ
jgi:hypothetical protein